MAYSEEEEEHIFGTGRRGSVPGTWCQCCGEELLRSELPSRRPGANYFCFDCGESYDKAVQK